MVDYGLAKKGKIWLFFWWVSFDELKIHDLNEYSKKLGSNSDTNNMI
jgi:hypothetical protein